MRLNLPKLGQYTLNIDPRTYTIVKDTDIVGHISIEFISVVVYENSESHKKLIAIWMGPMTREGFFVKTI